MYNADGTPILLPNLNVKVNLSYTKYLETRLTVKEKESIKKYLMEGISFNPEDKPEIKLTTNEEQSQDWHRDTR